MNNTNTTLDAVNVPSHFIKFAINRGGNSRGTRDYGTFQIHASVNLFPTFGRDYFGTPAMKVDLLARNKELLATLCGQYGVGGQSLTCQDGIKQEDGSWIFNGSYDCWSD